MRDDLVEAIMYWLILVRILFWACVLGLVVTIVEAIMKAIWYYYDKNQYCSKNPGESQALFQDFSWGISSWSEKTGIIALACSPQFLYYSYWNEQFNTKHYCNTKK